MIGPIFFSALAKPTSALAGIALSVGAFLWPLSAVAQAPTSCAKPVYLTLDTGGMQSADLIAQILQKHQVRATFFLANEKTFRGDYALDDSWKAYWQARTAEGHGFGSHTWRHGRILADQAGVIRYRPQFGEQAGQLMRLNATDFCEELNRVGRQFERLTGRPLDPIWRAPGGITTPETLRAAKACGYAHIHWSPAGFLGDELPSDRYPNRMLLDQALRSIRSGDILMAHLGIWSRSDPYAPMLDPLIAGLKASGFCFELLPQASLSRERPVR
jgi:peptidoglycan/xylan/chitin deacetylase (PgdA/CDA1 family)